MKLISSVVRPETLDGIKGELDRVNVHALTVAHIQDHTPQNHGPMIWRAREYDLGSSLKVEIRVVVHDDDADAVVEVILRAARTGRTGDGHVCVMPVDHCYDVATGRREASRD